jgi:hypothetical protein
MPAAEPGMATRHQVAISSALSHAIDRDRIVLGAVRLPALARPRLIEPGLNDAERSVAAEPDRVGISPVGPTSSDLSQRVAQPGAERL